MERDLGLRPPTAVATSTFYLEDLCCLKSNPSKLGLIERTFNDVNSHITPTQVSINSNIQLHPESNITDHQFASFISDGVPPQHSALVNWKNDGLMELMETRFLKLVDRTLAFGETVRRSPSDAMSGTVIARKMTCSLIPLGVHLQPRKLDLLPENRYIRAAQPCDYLHGIDISDLQPHTPVEPGCAIIYQGWVGRIVDVVEEVHVRMVNGSVVVVDDPTLLTLVSYPVQEARCEVGDLVTGPWYVFKRGRWISGSYDADMMQGGDIVKICPVKLSVMWLCPRSGKSMQGSAPAPELYLDYEQAKAKGLHIYESHEFAFGACVSFRNEMEAIKTYNGKTVQLDDGRNHVNKLHFTPPIETRGYDLNIFEMCGHHNKVTIQWQDLSVTEEDSTALVPDMNIEDTDEIWPGEIVTTKETHTEVGCVWRPEKVGVVQSVAAADRLAKVKWLQSPNVEYLIVDENGHCLLRRGISTGFPIGEGVVEDVSLYEINPAPDLDRRRGDFVIIIPWDREAWKEKRELPFDDDIFNLNKSELLDWFGEVTDVHNDGTLSVRLGAMTEPMEVRVPPEFILLAYNPDTDLTTDGEALSENDEGDLEENGALGPVQTWIVDDDGERLMDMNSDQEDWVTEGENSVDGDDDTLMADVDCDTQTSPKATLENPPPTADVQVTNPPPAVPRTEASKEIYNFSSFSNAPPNFEILDGTPTKSRWLLPEPESLPRQCLRRIQREHSILCDSLPNGVFVRTWESRLDLLRVLMLGPLETPYEFAPFVFDIRLPSKYPAEPPKVFFHSWTKSTGPINPNLYEDGTVCLSLLGTWFSQKEEEGWTPGKSTILQVLVSILGLVLTSTPYYNEPGFDVRASSSDFDMMSSHFSESIYFRTRSFVTYVLEHKIEGFADVVEWLFRAKDGPRIADRVAAAAKEIAAESEKIRRGGMARMSKGAVVMLLRQVGEIEAALGKEGSSVRGGDELS